MTVTTIAPPDFIVSDTHFGQHSIIDQADRRSWMGVARLTDMHLRMFAAWRAVVGPDQVVLHLGDHITAPQQRCAAIAAELSGHIILVDGNHDHTVPGVQARYEAVRFRLADGRQVLGVHDPADADRYAVAEDAIILHGHLHGLPSVRTLPLRIQTRCIDCSMDALRQPGPVPLSCVVAAKRP
jgi:calcineurin-like phosphoesterase family protein